MEAVTEQFLNEEVSRVRTGAADVAYRKFGAGPDLVLLHGWPLSSLTFRKLVFHLASRFTCYVVDVPGGGETEWTDRTDFSWPGQAATIKELADALGLGSYFLLGQDSGAMIGRHLALIDPRVQKMVMTNTEMPGHRPPWIPLYRALMFLPGINPILRLLLRSRLFLRSPLGFGNSFRDRDLLDGDFRAHVLDPLVRSARRMAGHNRFLRGWSWSALDRMAQDHAKITIPVLLAWGEDDPTFPMALAEQMKAQFPNAELRSIPGAKVFVHEEQPEALARLMIEFLTPAAA